MFGAKNFCACAENTDAVPSSRLFGAILIGRTGDERAD